MNNIGNLSQNSVSLLLLLFLMLLFVVHCTDNVVDKTHSFIPRRVYILTRKKDSCITNLNGVHGC